MEACPYGHVLNGRESIVDVAVGQAVVKRDGPALPGTVRTEANRRRILADIAAGVSFKSAAIRSGMSEDALWNWRRDDPDMAEACLRAVADREALLVDRWQRDGEGDWRSSYTMLQSSPHHRDVWGKQERIEIQQSTTITSTVTTMDSSDLLRIVELLASTNGTLTESDIAGLLAQGKDES